MLVGSNSPMKIGHMPLEAGTPQSQSILLEVDAVDPASSSNHRTEENQCRVIEEVRHDCPASPQVLTRRRRLEGDEDGLHQSHPSMSRRASS